MNEPYAPSEQAPGKILLVDDDPEHLELLTLRLRGQSMHVVTANSGPDAIALCEAQPFEGVLMDVNLPGMSGIEACRVIRATQMNEHTPVIFLSASRVKETDMLVGLEAGGMDYLTWPYSDLEVVAKLKVMICLSRQTQALIAAGRDRTLVEVLGGVAHELSQPLTAAQMLLDLWHRRGGSPSPEELLQMQAVLLRASKLVNDLRELRSYVTRPYGSRDILDLPGSRVLPS